MAKASRSSPHPLGLCPVPLLLLLPADRWAESGPWPLVTGFSPGGCAGIADWLVVDKYSIGKPLIHLVRPKAAPFTYCRWGFAWSPDTFTIQTPGVLILCRPLKLTACDSLLLQFFCKGPCISLFFSIILNSNFLFKEFSDLNRIHYVSKILQISNCFLFGFSSLLPKLYDEIVVDE